MNIIFLYGFINIYFNDYNKKKNFFFSSCQQCLMPFADGIYFENDEGVFCEYDNNVLFGY